MSDFATVKISRDLLLELLENRLDQALEAWGDKKHKHLYMSMYESFVYDGCFDEGEFDPDAIVDNDVVNYCTVVTREECPNDFDKLLELYHNGERDISCENLEDTSCNFIEAVSSDEEDILLRY